MLFEHMWIGLVVLVGRGSIQGHFVDTCTRTYPNGNGLVCRFCPAGSFLKNHCVTNNSISDCHPCPTGHYQPNCNVALSCGPCYQCERHGAIVLTACTSTHDTQCVCPPKKYYQQHSNIEGLCIPHTACPIGSGVIENGNAWADTKCGRCQPGTFSNNASYNRCHPCRKCDAYASKCSETTDARCSNVTTQSVDDEAEKSGLPLAGVIGIAVACSAALVLIILAVIFYIRRNIQSCYGATGEENVGPLLKHSMATRCNGGIENGHSCIPSRDRNANQGPTNATQTGSMTSGYSDVEVDAAPVDPRSSPRDDVSGSQQAQTMNNRPQGDLSVWTISVFLKAIVSYGEFRNILRNCPGIDPDQVDVWISNVGEDHGEQGCEEQLYQLLKRYNEVCPGSIYEKICIAMEKCTFKNKLKKFKAWRNNQFQHNNQPTHRHHVETFDNNATPGPHAQETKANYVDADATMERQNNKAVTEVNVNEP